MCDHPRIIDDPASGSAVCTDCGLVTDQLYTYGPNLRPESEFSDQILARIKTYTARLNIEQESIIQETATLFTQISTTVNNYPIEAVLAFAIWEVLNRNEVPQSPKDVAYACEARPLTVLTISNKLNRETTYCNPVMYVERVGKNLQLSYKFQKCIKRLLHYTSHLGMYKPEHLVCTCALIIAQHIRKKRPSFHPELTECKLQKLHFLSRTCVNQICQNIDHQLLQTLIDECEI